MSFCTDVKNELADLRLSNCCKSSLAYGFMLFGRCFSLKKISMQTSNRHLVDAYCSMIYQVFNIMPVILVGGKTRVTYKAYIASESDRLKILATYDFGIKQEIINKEIFKRECCQISFLRGAFLACGSVSDPDKEYRVEYNVKNESLAQELLRIFNSFGIEFKVSHRQGSIILYTKDSAVIEDFLTFLGASNKSIEIMNTKIIKSVKNNINRASNCDSANISKTVESSIAQRTAIDYLEKTDKLYSLPDELLDVAILRKNNPESTLKELCKLSSTTLSISGINHRMKKIVELYNNLKK